jgi:ornithine carbamoyltransferase
MAHSLLHGCAKTGIDIAIASPEGYTCGQRFVNDAKAAAEKSGSKVIMTSDPVEAISDADVVYSDTWASMGQEAEKEIRAKIFAPYTIDKKLFANAKKDAIFMHCLPAYRGYEVTEDVIDGPNSVIFDEAENRLHAQKAVLVKLMAR